MKEFHQWIANDAYHRRKMTSIEIKICDIIDIDTIQCDKKTDK